jgi:EmrB/QacA subfamily drug resistance transporter
MTFSTVITGPAPGGLRQRHPGLGIGLILLAQLMLIVDATVIQVALPRIRADLGFQPTSLLWVVNGYALPYGGLLLLGGRLGDVRGRFRVFQTGLTLFVLASLLAGLAPAAGWLIAARAAQGIGAALTAPGVLALLTVNAPDDKARQRAYALFAVVTSAGMTLGVVLGGVITALVSWRATMLINVPIGVLVLAATPWFVTEAPRAAERRRLDLLGAATATVGASALVYALVSAPASGWGGTQTVAAFAVAVTCLAAFAVAERRVAEPMLDLSLLRSAPRAAALLASTLVIGAQMSTFYFVTQFFQSGLRLGPLAAGLAFLPMSAGTFAMSRLAPKAAAKAGLRGLILAGTVLQAVALVIIGLLVDGGHGYWGAAFAPLLLDGVALGTVLMPITALALAGVPADRAGSMSGMLQTTQQLGAATGLAVVVSVYASKAVPGAFLPGARDAFLTAAALSALAFLAALTIAASGFRRRHRA